MEINGVFIDNCGHGYLQVTKEEFKQVMASPSDKKKITGYSGVRGESVYLEEDLDAGTFIKAAREKGFTVSWADSYQPNFECPKNYSPAKVN